MSPGPYPAHITPLRVSHIFFDIDGTLIDFMGALRVAMAAAAKAISARTGVTMTGDALWSAREAVTADAAWRGLPPLQLRRETFRRALADAHSADAVLAVDAAYEQARNAALMIYADVLPAIERLHARGFTLVAASNGNVDLEPFGLAPFFSLTHYAGDVGLAKPDPRFFEHAVRRAGARADHSVVVGDRIDNDYEPARAAGMHAVLIDRADRAAGAEVLRVASLAELDALLEHAG